jgi:hypothetical protein
MRRRALLTSKESTLQVKRINSRPRFVVTDDGEGIANHAGSALLVRVGGLSGVDDGGAELEKLREQGS